MRDSNNEEQMKICDFLIKNPVESVDNNNGRPVEVESYIIKIFTIYGPKHFYLEFDSRLKAYFALISHSDLFDPWKLTMQTKFFCRCTHQMREVKKISQATVAPIWKSKAITIVEQTLD